MNVFALRAMLTLDKALYQKGMSEARKETQEFQNEIVSKVSPKVATAFALIGTAVVKVTQQVVRLATESINYADRVSDLAKQYGVTTDAISEMQYIADQSSSSIEGLTSSMTMLYNRAKQDGDAFKRLGVSVKDTNGEFKTMDELFWETVGAMNDIENEGEKSAVMLDLFGRSAMSVGEVVRKSADEIARMRQEAHDLGVVMNENTMQFASDLNDRMAVLRLMGQSAVASLIAGEKDAEEKLQNFFDSVLETAEEYAPSFINFGVRLLMQTSIALVRISPTLVVEIMNAMIDTIFNIDWVELGLNIGKSILEGMVNVIVAGLNSVLGFFGVKIPKFSFGEIDSDYISEAVGGEYEISENVRQDINIKVEASGDSAVSKETAEKTAEALAPYIDKILGGK